MGDDQDAAVMRGADPIEIELPGQFCGWSAQLECPEGRPGFPFLLSGTKYSCGFAESVNQAPRSVSVTSLISEASAAPNW